MIKVKPIYMLIAFSFLALSSCNGQTNESPTEETCTGYFPLYEGASFELSSYDKKDKLTIAINHKVLESKSLTDGIEATCNMAITDQDGNKGQEITYKSKCQDGKYYMNLESLMSKMTLPWWTY